MTATPTKTTPALAALCAMLDAASEVAHTLPPDGELTHAELLDAIAASRICAKRLELERVPPRKRPGPRR